MVTSPGGTTIAAIRHLEQAGVRAAFLNAIDAARLRSAEWLAASHPNPSEPVEPAAPEDSLELVLGPGVARTGVAEADFGTTFANVGGIVVQANGRIVVVGGVNNGTSSDVAVSRFLP